MTDGSGAATFAAVLRDSRMWRGLTQQQLAAASKVSVRAIRDLESGATAGPRMQTVGLLADALGLDGTGRDALVRAARRGSTAPSTSEPPADRSARPRPNQLLRDVADFVGRDDVVGLLVAALTPGGGQAAAVTPVAIVGMGGIGKTALAVRVGHRVRTAYPDGALFVDLNGAGPDPLPVGDALVRLLRDLDVPESQIPADVEERAALLRTVTTTRRLLLVLDNAHDSAQVRPLLPGNPACAVIVTSRDDLGGLEGFRRVDLDPLAPADARTLLDRIAGPERLDAQPDAADDLVTRCAGLPLALRIVGARLATRALDVRALADRLAGSAALTELRAGDLAVRASLETSFAALEEDSAPGAAHALRLLGVWPAGDLDLRAGAAILGVPVPEGDRALERLVDVHLLQSPRPQRYRFHDLIRVFARERAEADLAPEERRAALGRVLDWYLRTADRAIELLAPYHRRFPLDGVGPALPEPAFADAAAALAWCDSERANMVTAVRTAAEAGLHHHSWMLGTVLFPYWEQRMLWPEFLVTHTVALDAARADGDRAGEGRALTGLAVVHLRSGNPRAAIPFARSSLAIHTELGDHFRRLGLLDQLARAHYMLGEVDEAVALLREAVYDPHADDPFRLATCLVTLGIIQRDTGALDDAVTTLERALRIAEAADLPYGEVPALRSLGEAYLRRGDLEAAERALLRCIDRAQVIDARPHQAEARSLLGEIALARGDAAGAADQLAGALGLMEALGHKGQAEARRLLSVAAAAASATAEGRAVPRPRS